MTRWGRPRFIRGLMFGGGASLSVKLRSRRAAILAHASAAYFNLFLSAGFNARAQQPQLMRRVGVLMSAAETDPTQQAEVNSLRKGLQELGWVQGRNMQLELRWGNADALVMQKYAAEFVQTKPDVLIGNAPTATRALQRATEGIPIVFTQIPDPVEAGFVASIPHPGGNITGFTHFEPSLATKWVGLLKEISPTLNRVAIVFSPTTVSMAYFPPLVAAAQRFAVDAIETPYHEASDLNRAVGGFAEIAKGGLIVLPDASNTLNRKLIVKLAAQYRLPAIYPYASFVTDGGLVCYGVDAPDLFQRAASYVDRILKGEKPADLPVQAPTKFELVINLKTANTLGLTVPQSLLTAADEVIE